MRRRHSKKRLMSMLMASTLCGSLCCSCATTSGPAKKSSTITPEWVKRGSGPVAGLTSSFYGVGASNARDGIMARVHAEDRARAELSKILSIYVASLMKEYMATITATDDESSHADEYFVSPVAILCAAILPSAQIADHWVDDGDADMMTSYALARLAIADVLGGVDRFKDLDEKARAFIHENAERIFTARVAAASAQKEQVENNAAR
jgi:hypothetical protein